MLRMHGVRSDDGVCVDCFIGHENVARIRQIRSSFVICVICVFQGRQILGLYDRQAHAHKTEAPSVVVTEKITRAFHGS